MSAPSGSTPWWRSRRDRLILGAAYMLYLYRRVIFGTLHRADLRGSSIWPARESRSSRPCWSLVLWMGVYPTPFLRPIQASVDHLVQQVTAAPDGGRHPPREPA